MVEDVGGAPFVSGAVARTFLRGGIAMTRFDVLHAGRVRVEVAPIARRANVDFRLFAIGRVEGPMGTMGFGTQPTDERDSDWSIGLEETAPGQWKVNRITPLSLPGGARLGSLGFAMR
jgi:hypothetical protein